MECFTPSDIFITATTFLVVLWVVTMTIFGIVTTVLCWKIHKLKLKGKLLIKSLSRNNSMHPFNSSQHAVSLFFLFQPLIRGAPPPPLLLPIPGPFLPLTLTPSNFYPIPATVQWRGAIDCSTAACISEG